MSNLPGLVLRDEMPTSHSGREPSAIPTPAHNRISCAKSKKKSAAHIATAR